MAEGVLDRRVNSAHRVATVGKSFRPNRRAGQRLDSEPNGGATP